jgi:PadR family transcriptional regulator, regulatory protein PadR
MAVLEALAADPAGWRYGYDLCRETGLKAGSLYPILIRLADRGQVEARWEVDRPQGRPARHMYRLTATGLAFAAEVTSAEAAPAPAKAQPAGRKPVPRAQPAPRVQPVPRLGGS